MSKQKKNFELESEFNKWKNPEDEILRNAGWSEEAIQALRKQDHHDFVDIERKHIRKSKPIEDPNFIENRFATYDEPIIHTIFDLMNQIEDEKLYTSIKESSSSLKDILWYLYLGYSIDETAKLNNLSPNTVSVKLHRFKKNLKNF